MKNITNIYDIDGNIIRKAGDNHRFTIDEIEKMVDDLAEKVKQNPENQVYRVYLNNAEKYLYMMYNSMSPEEVKSRLTSLENILQKAKDDQMEQEVTEFEEIGKAMEQLKTK